MLVAGSLYADLFARIGASSQHEARNAAAQEKSHPASAPTAHGADGGQGQAYVSMISPISHGSLAAAYQMIRGREAEGLGQPGQDRGGEAAAQRSILSGLGIPSAMSAYDEVLEGA
jgi:hypothetical protein